MNINKIEHCIYHIDLGGFKVSYKQSLSATLNNYFEERASSFHPSIPNSASHYHRLIPINTATKSLFYTPMEKVKEFMIRMN